MLTQLGLDPDREPDVSKFFALGVTTLLTRGVAVALDDNVGHQDKDRPTGSATKLDAVQQGYLVETTSKFSPVETGSIRITCKRSRYGDDGRTWTMRIGSGVFDLPVTDADPPDAKRVKAAGEKRCKFIDAALAALREEQPLGRDTLLEAVRERGVQGRATTLRDLLAEVAADPASGILADPVTAIDSPHLPLVPTCGTRSGPPPSRDPLVPLVPPLRGTRGARTLVPTSRTAPGHAAPSSMTTGGQHEPASLPGLPRPHTHNPRWGARSLHLVPQRLRPRHHSRSTQRRAARARGRVVKPQATAPVPRLALTREEAAASLGMSLSAFQTHVQPDLRLIRRGSLRLIPVAELQRWVDRNQETTA